MKLNQCLFLCLLGIYLLFLTGCTEPSAPDNVEQPSPKPESESYYSLTIVIIGNGESAPSGTIIIDTESPTLYIYGNPGHCSRFYSWSVASGKAEIAQPDSAATTVTLESDSTINANFGPVQYSLTLLHGEGGSITEPGENPLNVFCGSGTSINALPEPGFNFNGWTVLSGNAYFENSSDNMTTVFLDKENAIIRADFTVCSLPPTGVTADPEVICSGEPVLLCVDGGALGDDATWIWYSESCGGTYIGCGNCINVSPSESTTYFVRAEGGCETTVCSRMDVIVRTEAIAAENIVIYPEPPVCSGEPVSLSVSGGSPGIDAEWVWYEEGCGGTKIGSGSSIAVSPSSATTYYVRAEGPCNTTDCISCTVAMSTYTLTVLTNGTSVPETTTCTYYSDGTVSPSGDVDVICGKSIGVTASPYAVWHCLADPYPKVYFKEWEIVSGDCVIANYASASTTVQVNGDATIKAIYWKISPFLAN